MPKLNKAKKQAKRQARKTAKKPAPANGRTLRRPAGVDPKTFKPGKMTARRGQAQWSQNLRDQPVRFVKSMGEDVPQSLEKFYTVVDSSDSSDDENLSITHSQQTDRKLSAEDVALLNDTHNFDQSLNTWLAQEVGLSEDEPVDTSGLINDSFDAEMEVDPVDTSAVIGPNFPSIKMSIDATGTDSLARAPSPQSWEDQNGITVLSDTEAPDFEPEPQNCRQSASDIEDYYSEDNNEGDGNDLEVASGDELSADELFSDKLDLEDSEEDEIMLSFDDVSPGEMGLDSDISESAAQDYLDNMSDLDDDQIFALASMGNVVDNEDYNVMDDMALDARDAYFDDLIGSGFDLTKLKRQQKANKAQKNRKQSLLKDLRRANKAGALQLLWMKYPHTITVYEVVDELNTYAKLRNIQPKPLAFPPLDSNANWYIKEFADYMGLTSQVNGTRESKSIVVTINNRTHGRALTGEILKLTKRRQNFRRSDSEQYGEEFSTALQQVVNTVILRGTHSNKPSKEAKNTLIQAYTMDRKQMADKVIEAMMSGEVLDLDYISGTPKRTIDKKLKASSAKVRDGHVVGHNANAIETTNFGHKLLLQMGWTSGSGLGKERAGITAPLPATVKLTRGGLGG